MLANQQNQANNAQVAGYGQAIDEINQDAATTLGEAKRAGVSPSNLYNILSRLNQQKGAQKRRLYAAGQEAQERRLGTYNTGLMGKARMDEQARQEQEEAIGALRGAGMQNYYNAFTSGIGALGYGMQGLSENSLKNKTNALAKKGYNTDSDLGGRTLDDIPDSLINQLPDRLDTERTQTLEGMTPSYQFYNVQPQGGSPSILSGYGSGYGTYQSDAYNNILARKRYTGDTFR
jgi:hypothetical protein